MSLLLSGVAGCGNESGAELVARAKVDLQKKDEKAAIVQLKSALQRSPDLSEARFLLGATLLRAGDASGAAVELQKSLELKHSANLVSPLLAEALLLSGQAKKVVERFADVSLTEVKATAALKAVVAAAYFDVGDPAQGSQAVDAALGLDPGNVAARLLSARRSATAGDIDGALKQLKAISVTEPKRVEATLLTGNLLWYGKSDKDAALSVFRDLVQAEPRYLPAHAALARLLLDKGDAQGFRTEVGRIKSTWPDIPLTRYLEVQLAMLDRDLPRARTALQSLLTVAAGDPAALQLAGVVELQSGGLKMAETHLVKALQLAPDVIPARRLLAEAQLRSGQVAKALLTLQPLVEGSAPDAEALALAGQAQLQSGDLGKAEDFFSRAAQANPNDPKSRTALALAQISRGHADTGFAQLEALTQVDKTAFADLALITARLQRNDLKAALLAIDGLEAKGSGKPLPHVLRGRVLVALKDLAGARKSFEKALEVDPVNFTAVQDLASIDLAERKPLDARKRYDALLTRDPKNVLALLAVAELRQNAGEKPDQIESLLLEAVKLAPADPAPRLVLIDHRLRLHQAKGAVSAAQEGVAAIPDSTQLQDALGRAHLAAGDVRQALGLFNKVANLRSGDPQPLLRLAEAHLANGDHALAVQSLQRALAIKPDLVMAQRGLVKIALLRDRVEDAVRVASAVQKQRPKEAVGYQMEGEIYLGQGDFDRAQTAFKAALDREPSTPNVTRVHALLSEAGRTADADRLAANWLRANPKDAAFFFYLGLAAVARADFPTGEARYREALALQPDNASTLNNLAWLMVKQGKPGAVALAEQANKLSPDNVTFLDTLATALAADKQVAKAIELQQKAIALAPQMHSLHLNLARYLAANGDRATALAELEKLKALGAHFEGQAEVAALLKTL